MKIKFHCLFYLAILPELFIAVLIPVFLELGSYIIMEENAILDFEVGFGKISRNGWSR